MSETAILSSKFQITIPATVRAARGWKAGQALALIPKGTGILLMPVPERDELAGIAKAASAMTAFRSFRRTSPSRRVRDSILIGQSI